MLEVKTLQGQVRALVEDLRVRVAEDDSLRGELRREYDAAGRAQRVGGGFDAWLAGVLDQAAVAWVLGCVFVRFCSLPPSAASSRDLDLPLVVSMLVRREQVGL